MKILAITPTIACAITTLSQGIIKYSKHQFKLITLHPKKPNATEIKNLNEGLKWCDIIDAQYWKSASKARELCPELWKTKKKVLTHYNPYNLHEESWEDYNKIVVVNNYQKSQLPQAHLIPMGVDQDFFKFNKDYTKDKIVNMVVSRIEGKKGVQEVAQACKELEYKFILIGRISDPNYTKRVLETGGKYIEFHQDVNDKELRNYYYQSAIHVFNSVPNFESGSLPVLEAMSSGVPVIAGRDLGHVSDIYNGKNIQIFSHAHNDVESLKKTIKNLMDNFNLRNQMRIEAKNSIKNRTHQNYSKEFDKIYESL